LANISCDQAARELLECCLRGEPWPRSLLLRLMEDDCSRELFRIVAEGLADRFEPALCDTYSEIFSEALAAVEPELDAEALLARYRRIRKPRLGTLVGRTPWSAADALVGLGGPGGLPHRGIVRNVYVLSRVTLGADVAITSVILHAAKRRFPDARIFLAGSRKAWELFEDDDRIEHLPIAYPRSGSLRQRLGVWRALRQALSQPDSITIDPDSRLTQLGLAPVCAEEDYYFFESRAYGGDGDESLGTLTKRWVAETFGVEDSRAYLAPKPFDAGQPAITVSLGVGQNPAKRIGDPFEAELLAALAQKGMPMLIDKGAGGEEAERVEKAMPRADHVRCWDGSFAGFAAAIAGSRLYVGYDSAGQHVAAACGVPLVSIFAGFPTPRMMARWRPTGPGRIEVVRADSPDPNQVLAMALDAIGRL
jgi:ADP-heptose:LPS heptosyltransferase